MTGAKVLAVGGILSALVLFLSEPLQQPWMVSAAGGVMLGANLITLTRKN